MKKKRKQKRIDPMSCNVPNICFSLMKTSDNRWCKYKGQRLSRGFDDSETWNLDTTIAKFIIPRLERFIEIYEDFVIDHDGFVPKMKNALECFKMYEDENTNFWDKETSEKFQRGMHDFADIFQALWW